VGSSREIWYIGGPVDLFFIGGFPAVLGPAATGTHARGELVYRLASDTTSVSALETCARGGIRKVVSDGTTFVALAGSVVENAGSRQTTYPPEILVGRFGSP
ncbi:MAG TPA: hypothetical protein VGG65_05260, partial [Thermoanaerobaculia bacterium]